jgi:hypothetical protein
MEAPGNPQQQAVGTSSAPPAPGIPSDHDGGTPVTPRHTTADDPIMSRPLKRRLLLEAEATEATTATGTLLELKETLIEQARDELRDAMQSMVRSMEAAFKEYRQAEEERWGRARKEMEEFWKVESRKMLEAMQEGRAAGTQARWTGGGPEEMEATDPTALAEGSDEMEVTQTGRRTQLDFSKHAVNVHDRDETPAVQPKNISKHALADPGNDRPSETPKASPQPTERKTAKPTPGLGAVRPLKATYAQAATAQAATTSRQSTTTKEAGWNVMGPKGKVQKVASDDSDWLRPLKERSNPEDDRKVIFPRDGVTPHPGGNVQAILSEINRALRRAGVPDHIKLWTLQRNAKGMLTALTRKDSNARQLLHYKDTILIAARKADPGIIDVQSNETWAKLKIHGVPLDLYNLDAHGLQTLREDIEAENPGVVIPIAPRWVGSQRRLKERHDQGEIRGASVMFSVQDKRIAERLLTTGLRAAGRPYRVERYAIDGPDSICENCSKWGHIAEKCESSPRCYYCAKDHPATQHHCGTPDCKEPKSLRHQCKYTIKKCANCGADHPALSEQCVHRQNAIRTARARRNHEVRLEPPGPPTTGTPTPSPPSGTPATSGRGVELSYDDSDGDRIMAVDDEPQL